MITPKTIVALSCCCFATTTGKCSSKRPVEYWRFCSESNRDSCFRRATSCALDDRIKNWRLRRDLDSRLRFRKTPPYPIRLRSQIKLVPEERVELPPS